MRAELLDAGALTLTLAGSGLLLRAVYDGQHCRLELDGVTGPVLLRSRRAGRVEAASSLALCLTGTYVSVLTQDHTGGPWTGRARADLATTHPAAARLVRTPAWLEDLQVGHDGPAHSLVAGGFGQLGLRDLRLVTHADGRPYDDGTGLLRFLATSAGPGPFGSGHTSVWALDPAALDHSTLDHGGGALTHTADLFVRRLGSRGVHGDHAGHLLRDDDAWLLATSTWGDFDPDRDDASVAVTLAATGADLLTVPGQVRGEHDPLPRGVDEPGGREADARHPTTCGHLLHGLGQCVLDELHLDPPARRHATGRPQHLALRGDLRGDDLGATDVHADDHRHLRSPGQRRARSAAPMRPARLPRRALRISRLGRCPRPVSCAAKA